MIKLFLSFSGDRSQAIAEALRVWLPKVIQAVDPWMAAVDIQRGARWSTDIGVELENTSFGVLCLTPENLEAPWIHFEAGALSKTLKTPFVCPYLFQLAPSDLRGPLVQFNAAKAEKDDTRKLVLTINDAQEFPLEPNIVEEMFEIWWPKLEQTFDALKKAKLAPKTERPEHEILLEILDLVRGQIRSESGIDIEEIGDSQSFLQSAEFQPGSYVYHEKYGRGLVLRREGQGADIRLTVSFPGYGQKRLMQRYANLKKG